MVSGVAPPLVADVRKYIFHYLDFRGQACCARVCKLWNKTLYELEYEYGRYQALKALNQLPPLNLPVLIKPWVYILGVKGPYILLSIFKAHSDFWNLNFYDIQAKKQQEVCVNPGRSDLRLCSAQWISHDRFVTLSVNSAAKPFYEAVLWEISQKDDIYQFDSISQISFQKRGGLPGLGMLPLEKRLFIGICPEESYYDENFGSLESWLQLNLFMIMMRDSTIEMQQVKVPSNTYTYLPSMSNSKMIFALKDETCLNAFHLTPEGEAKLAWKYNINGDLLSSDEANDLWVVVREYLPPASPEQPIQQVFRIFDSRTGQKAFAFKIDWNSHPNTIDSWLKGDFLAYLEGKDLSVIHIPSRSYLSSIQLSEVLPAQDYSLNVLDINIDKNALNIVYEDAAGIQVHQVKLESQHGKPSFPPLQVFAPPKPRPVLLTIWARFLGFISTMISFPIRLWRWIRSIFSS